MKVSIGLRSRFHAYDLARELAKQGSLAMLYSGLPYYRAAQFGVPKNHYQSILVPEILARLAQKLPQPITTKMQPGLMMDQLFDEWLARILSDDIDVFLGWSGCCLSALKAANQKGITSVVERGSSHIEVQRDLLFEEYERWGLPHLTFPQKVIERELAGYEEAQYISIPSHFAMQSFLEKGIPKE